MAEVKYDDKPDVYKDLYYFSGRLYEELKNVKAAEEAYQKVLEVDYEYKDKVDRLNKLQGAPDSSPSPE